MNSVKRRFSGLEFSAIADIQPERDAAGYIVEDTFQLGPEVRHNNYSAGPFCRFRVAQSITSAGVYALTVADRLMYIGECENLAKRYSSTGYGRISPRNCHSDGQSTNCKINALILRHTKAGEPITLWFHQTTEYKSIEATLIQELSPPWNGRLQRVPPQLVPPRPREKTVSARGLKSVKIEPSTNERKPSAIASSFRDALGHLLDQAHTRGENRVRVQAGDLHRIVGGYPGSSHRMPVCCGEMRRAMISGDRQVQAPPKGTGASLTIEYRLPRE
ncbi:MAG: GIY-YIG nuclease family protein [Bryobacterales bacterium]|nr:GIY-YIG nuclease family protein [Bryobacterales bacterium]